MMNKIDPRVIKPNDKNPRKISEIKFQQLVKSIKDFPEMLELRPIVVDDDMIVLGGNMRLKAIQAAGLQEVPYVMAKDLTPEQKQEFIIKDNLGYGEWDWDVLQTEWNLDILENWGMDVIRHDWTQLDFITEDVDLPKPKDHTLLISLCERCVGDKDNIRKSVNDYLSENFPGCEIK